ncbi:protein O-linked-mannose beta-1,4-N-acetylglucosaminyltransferase 2-like [Olea europaea var. sylvestris]|uniref:protein O-linked-mannose beta-1,4-N-acetylglucosaminyltransferase 2-like n=1 Tax=Olea europaea var. sylvestris TaxID=158386 RepID=UPI000C1CEE3E|nr:protein O-linked-mannose beta-1,4-N-acetylglucosaminyltransferase 2-like [Olea europaea var. sylvestris]
MEKEPRRLVFGAIPIVFLLILPLLFVDFFWGNVIPYDQWIQYFSGSATANSRFEDQQKSFDHLLARLVRGEDRRKLEVTGFACDTAVHSVVCVANQPVRIETSTMKVYIPSNRTLQQETVVYPHARQEDKNFVKTLTPVRLIYGNITPPACDYTHDVPAVIFSSKGMGNVFHEFNEIVIPLFVTTRQFESRVFFILEDFKPSFMNKYGKVVSHLSNYEVMNPAANRSVHCFPGFVVGLKYHNNLALNFSDIPGGYSMRDFRHFLREAYNLKFLHVSEIKRPRLILLSRRNTRRFLNEDEMVAMMKELGFQVIVVSRSKIISDLNKFANMINSCSVLVGAHGAGLTNEMFLPAGAVMVQVELLGLGWAADTYYGDPARAMDVHYLKYKIEPEESSLLKLYGRNHSVITDPGYLFDKGGYRAARQVYLDMQNVRINLSRFRETMVEALSLVADLDS